MLGHRFADAGEFRIGDQPFQAIQLAGLDAFGQMRLDGAAIQTAPGGNGLNALARLKKLQRGAGG